MLIGFNIFLILVCLSTAGGLAYLYAKVRDIGRIEGIAGTLSPIVETAQGRAENFLIVGTDSGEGLDPKDPVLIGRPGGVRSDTIMILHVDPTNDTAQLLSLPRDLYVPIAGLKGSDRINSAIQGGPARLIETIKNDFGIPINHYIEINFLAFRKIVDAVGGVPIYFTTPARDGHTGLDVPQAGCVTLDPVQALAFARSRSYEYFENGRWKTDPTGDLGRVSRQQEFIRKVLNRVIDKGARSPIVLNELINAGIDAVNLDPTLTADDLIELGKRFKDFNPENLTTYSVPSTAANVRGASVLLIKADEAEGVFKVFRGVDVNTPDSILVLVQNGTPQAGVGQTAADQLRRAGFGIPDGFVGDAERFDFAQTTIRYLPGGASRAQHLASYLVAAPVFEEVSSLAQSDVSVVVGADWQGVRSTPGPLPDLPTTTTTTTTLPSSSRRTTTSTTTTVPVPDGSTTSTTTTVPGVVPATPPDVRC